MVRQQHPGMQRGSTVVLCCFEVTLSNLHYVMCLLQIDLKPHIHGESGPQCDSASKIGLRLTGNFYEMIKSWNKFKKNQRKTKYPIQTWFRTKNNQNSTRKCQTKHIHQKKSNIKTKPKENPVYSTFICGCCLFALFLHVFPSCRFLFALFSRLLCFFLRCFTCSKILVTRSPAKEKEREKRKQKQPHVNVFWICFVLFCFVVFGLQNSGLVFCFAFVCVFLQTVMCFFCMSFLFFVLYLFES